MQVKKAHLTEVTGCLPPSSFAFAYGSGAFRQEGGQVGDLLDLVLGVENSREWHEQNLGRNAHHYAPLPRRLGVNAIVATQERFGAKVRLD